LGKKLKRKVFIFQEKTSSKDKENNQSQKSRRKDDPMDRSCNNKLE
jgi:hypothetical protein